MNKEIEEEANFVEYPVVGAKYEHYKGGLYSVITLATHSETDEKVVVYKSLLFGSVHVRPLSMWFDIVTRKKKIGNTISTMEVPRFKISRH